MKKRIALLILAIGLLAVAGGCELYTGITLTWGVINTVTSSSYTTVNYWVENQGQYDLTGVNLEFGLDTTGYGTYTYTGVTPSFSINQGQTISSSIVIYTPSYVYNAAVLMVDMDSPSGSKTVIYKKD